MKKIFAFLSVLLLLGACKIDSIATYSGLDNIYINEYERSDNDYSVDAGIIDTSLYTFKSVAGDTWDATIVVRVLGFVSDIDRPYILGSNPAYTTAVAGQDYTILNEDFYIDAGAVTDTVTIRLLNNENLSNTLQRLALIVSPNEYFATEYDLYLVPNTDSTVSRIQHTIIFGDAYIEPENWRDAEGEILGAFSAVKVNLLVEIGGLEEILIYTDAYTDNELIAAAHDVQLYLNEQAALGNIIVDETGTPVVMGPSAQ